MTFYGDFSRPRKVKKGGHFCLMFHAAARNETQVLNDLSTLSSSI